MSGPIILWIPGESPLHSLFLRRGLAYELANATSGLLVALEHRFYGNSIPRLQDSRTSKKIDTTTTTTTIAANNIALDEENQAWTSMAKKISNPKTEPNNSIKTKTISTNKNYILKTSSTIKASKLKKTKGDVKSGSNSTSTKNNPQKNKDTTKETKNKSNGSRSAGEGLPLDLLTYLTVDQSIEDIAYFIDQFPTIQPTYFRDTSTNNTKLKSKSKLKSKITDTRWIIAGCSYGGNLAAWTRQRYPSKIFAVFASSAPVHSVLDFYEYSTSQSNIVGKQCAKRMEHARDFLDEALQMTDGFMKQMALLDLATTKNSKENMEKSLTTPESNPLEEKKELAFLGQVGEPERNGAYSLISATASHKDSKDNSSKGNDSNKSNKKNDKKAREAAKLRVLTWFSSDFAKEYALEGEEVHAAGWIWWTVASAVQYNGIVTPPTIQPPKTTVDILCDTMAQADNSGMGAGDSEDSNSDDGNNGTINSSSASANKTVSLRNLEYAQALASWFKYQQYFTPTRTEGLQPSDLDPNSAQNLASVAWLWQTCSELGYLQTSQPSTCGCPPISSTTTTTYTNQNQTKSTLKQKGESFNVNTLAIITEDSSDIYDGIVKKSKIPLSISPPFSHHKGKLLKSNPITKSTTSACLPCRGYASHRARVKESMFSRLLTLEAAWQECQYYFGTNATAQQSQPKPSGISRTNGKRIQKKVEEQLSRGIIIDKKGGINSNSNNTSSSVNLTGPLLRGYPDVDKNVNNKFHGWEIVEEAEIITWDERSRSYEFTTSSNRWQAADKIRSPSKKSNSMLAFDNQPSSTSSATLSYDPVDDSNGDFDSSYSSFGPSGNDDSGGGIGRYYFTNGENDPWKDLTLASPQAIEFMKRRSDKSKAKEHHLKSKLSTDIAMDREVSNPSPKSANHPDLKHHKSHHHHHHHRHNHNHNHHHKHKKHDHHSCYHRPHHRRRHDHHPSHHRYQHGSCIKSGHRIKQGSHTHHPKEHKVVHPSKFSVRAEESNGTVTYDKGTKRDNGKDAVIARGVVDEEDPENERNIVRIIPGASHCQDILYESSDLESVELREERQYVLKTFVRWIEIDVKRQERVQKQHKS
ncbi:hypothetical protein BGZ49_009307 [Haplosporangium sp. Z 27]|nr:hypothetical protein BGZ49_009307 [Haplosporangium sp. Z 27]